MCTAQLAVERLYVGPLMTALDMKGFSLTLLEVDRSRLELLDAHTEVRSSGSMAHGCTQQVDHVEQLRRQDEACMMLVHNGCGDAPGLSLH